jgi:hypothetical protein
MLAVDGITSVRVSLRNFVQFYIISGAFLGLLGLAESCGTSKL